MASLLHRTFVASVGLMRFEKINLKGKKRLEVVKALVCQLRFDESDWVYEDDLLRLNNEPRVEDYIGHISYAISNHNADLIVLPEVGVPNHLLSQLQNLSKTAGVIIVGGTQYFHDGGKTISRCPVIVNGSIYYTEKINPSPFEISPIKNRGLSKGETIRIFKNSLIGDFAVIICADYFDKNIRTKLASYNLDFVIVIAFQNDSTKYHDRMNADCEESRHGTYFLYSNILSPPMGDGRSGLFGIMDKIFSSHLKRHGWSDGDPETKLIELSSEERLNYFLVDVDVVNKKPSLIRNLYTKPNVSIASRDEAAKEYEMIEDHRKKLKHLSENIRKRRES